MGNINIITLFIVYVIIISLGILWSDAMVDFFHYLFPDQDKSWSGIGTKFGVLIAYTVVCMMVTVVFFGLSADSMGKFILQS